MNRIAFCLFGLLVSLFADCKVDYRILYGIAKTESHPKREVGYPYLISFNNKGESKILKKTKGLNFIFLDNRTIDCKNTSSCIAILNFLEKKKITNLDLGAFQINYRWHKLDKESYFSVKDSLDFACSHLMTLGEERGWGWEAIASYHSKTPKHNERYRKVVIKHVMEMIDG